MKIIKYRNTSDITVEFQDEYKYQMDTTYQNFKIGQIKNPYDKTVYGVGYLGVGEYVCWSDNKHSIQYTVWENMLCRCYHEKDRNLHLAYAECTVCEEWHNFQTFAKWYDDNYYDIGEGRMHLDKDIIINGNKIYSPDTCVFLPQRINMIFMKKDRKVDYDLPSGIKRCSGGYKASYNTKYLGVHETLSSALEYYMIEKRIHIKKLAEEYRGRIQPKAYEALIIW